MCMAAPKGISTQHTFCFVNMVKENEGDPANQSETCGVAWILEPEMRGKLGKDEC